MNDQHNNTTDRAAQDPPIWKMVGCPEPRGMGQRFFLRDHDDCDLYICDNSGENPGRTDDGPLRFLPGKKIYIRPSEICSNGISISVSVMPERYDKDDGSHCGVSVKELLWMLDEGYANVDKIELDEKLLPVAKLYMRLSKRTRL